ncbi:hypothetical protein BH11BAC1_BH11BAC1_06320 [soil metagenome]
MQNNFTQTISTPVLMALKDALTFIYWRKNDLRSFLSNTITNRTIVDTLNWDNPKFDVVSDLVDRMVQRKDFYFDDMLLLIREACNMNDFKHLEFWDDAPTKIKRAKEAVKKLREQSTGFFEIIQEKKEAEGRKVKAQQKISMTQSFQCKLEELRMRFILMHLDGNSQQKGYKLEKLLYDLFLLFDLSPRSAFKLLGEQIDGAFFFEHQNFLMEAKFTAEQVQLAAIHVFHGKISGKLKNTLGLFISINGFTKECIASNITLQSKSVILMDGIDLMNVLENRIGLDDMISSKKSHASETGQLMYRVMV